MCDSYQPVNVKPYSDTWYTDSALEKSHRIYWNFNQDRESWNTLCGQILERALKPRRETDTVTICEECESAVLMHRLGE